MRKRSRLGAPAGRLPPLVGFALLPLSWLVPALAQSTYVQNPTPIAVSGSAPAVPYPSTIAVRDLAGPIAGVSVTLSNVTHSTPDDLDILLAGPEGQTVLLMSDAGGADDVSNLTLTFSGTASLPLPDETQLRSGTYAPSNFEGRDLLPEPAPPGPYGTDLTVFRGTNPNGEWRLFVLNDSGRTRGAISDGWFLEIEVAAAPPVITRHPQSQTVATGGTVTFEVEAAGTLPLTYQWIFNGRVIVPFSEGRPTLTISSVQALDAGSYSVMVTNRAGRVLSREATLSLAARSIVVGSPRRELISLGETVTLEAASAIEPTASYQWYLNGAVLPGETNATLTLTGLEANRGGDYSVLVYKETEATRSEPTRLVLAAATVPPATDRFAERPRLREPRGTMQADISLGQSEPNEPLLEGGGRSAWFEWTAPADGIVTFTTQGSAFDTLLAVFTGEDLGTLRHVTSDDDSGGFYTSRLRFNAGQGVSYQIAVDGFGRLGAGSEFNLTWELEETKDLVPSILTQPASQAVARGSTAMLRVESGSPLDSYQWLFKGEPLPGATGSTYTIDNANSAHVGPYSVVISNLLGRTTESAPVQVQLGAGDLVLVHDKVEHIFLPSANGNRATQGFIAIGLGGIVYTNEFYSLADRQATDPDPCDEPFYGTLWLGLSATNHGLIRVETTGSEIPARLAIYQLTGGISDFELGAIVCDVTSGAAGAPCVAQFEALQGTNYTVVVEGYQAVGNLTLTSQMGAAPPIIIQPQCVQVQPGGGLLLDAPNSNWVPAPTYQWRRNGQDIPGANGVVLSVENFDASLAGTYSVRLSNFVESTTVTVAEVSLGGLFQLNHSLLQAIGTPALVLSASAGQPIVLETALSLGAAWTPVWTNTDPCSTLVFTNSNLHLEPQRFYRAVLRPGL